MTIRRTMKARRAMATCVLTTSLVLTVAGCGGDDDGGDDKGSSATPNTDKDSSGGGDGNGDGNTENEVLAQVKGGAGGNLTLTVHSAIRSGGGFLTVTGAVRNEGKSLAVVPGWQSDETELADNGLSMASAKLTDQAGKKRYLILRDTEGRCLCTRFQGGFPQGETKDWFAQFPAPPASTTEVTFEVADLPPATIEISDE